MSVGKTPSGKRSYRVTRLRRRSRRIRLQCVPEVPQLGRWEGGPRPTEEEVETGDLGNFSFAVESRSTNLVL